MVNQVCAVKAVHLQGGWKALGDKAEEVATEVKVH